MKDVLLVAPPLYENVLQAEHPPIALAYLHAVLVGRGLNVELVDMFDWSKGQMESYIRSHPAKALGVNCLTNSRSGARDVSRAVAAHHPGTSVVWGGVHATVMWELILRNYPEVSCLVLGEGEDTAAELFPALLEGRPVDLIAGIASRREGRPERHAARPLITDLDRIPWPSREVLQWDRYPASRYANIVFSTRGCPFQCEFCSAQAQWGRTWRKRRPEAIIDEIEDCLSRYRFSAVSVTGENFTVDRAFVNAFCDEILRRNLRFTWFATGRVGSVDSDTLGKMKAAGCSRIQFGLESGSQTILDNIGKGTTVVQARETAALVQAAGIGFWPYWIVGCPGETAATIDETIALVDEIKPGNADVHVATLYPDCDWYNQAKAKGVISDEYWLTDQNPPVYQVAMDEETIRYHWLRVNLAVIRHWAMARRLGYFLRLFNPLGWYRQGKLLRVPALVLGLLRKVMRREERQC